MRDPRVRYISPPHGWTWLEFWLTLIVAGVIGVLIGVGIAS